MKGVVFMPRMARQKDKQSIYHVMVRSIKEVDLFETEKDKIRYFKIIRKYKEKYQFKLYAFCLMDNHGHLMIDANGADISKIMHSINFSYAQYFNREHNRHGHLFQERFKSKIVEQEDYLITLSAYIHRNAQDITGYGQHLDKYPFSSLGEYVNDTDQYGILDKEFLYNLLDLKKGNNLQEYLNVVAAKIPSDAKLVEVLDTLDIEFEKSENEYRSHRKILPRNHTVEGVIEFVAKHTGCAVGDIRIKNNRKYTKIRALGCFLMNCFCNIDQKRLCTILGNISQQRVSSLCSMGIDIAYRDKDYEGIVDKFIEGA
jgi:putative transposase